ncbi:MAG TPA: hypothetical protein V6C99_02955 [Oculatellaceae cyanobacterium]|jgi:hypothetical protein
MCITKNDVQEGSRSSCVFVSCSSGIHIGATVGAEIEGERQGAFRATQFSEYIGIGTGALDAVLTANHWSAEQKKNLFLKSDFQTLCQAEDAENGAMCPLRLSRLANWLFSLMQTNPFGPPIQARENLLIGFAGAEGYCFFGEKKPARQPVASPLHFVERSFSPKGLVRSLVQAMVLSEPVHDLHALLQVLPDESPVLLVDSCPDAALARQDWSMRKWLKMIIPEVKDIDSTDLGIDQETKETLVIRGMWSTLGQWPVNQR